MNPKLSHQGETYLPPALQQHTVPASDTVVTIKLWNRKKKKSFF